MQLVRSWPRHIPQGRSYVVDQIPKLTIDNMHYGALGDLGEDTVLLEWDVAVDRQELECFIDQARSDPGRVLVAPYRIYYENLPWPVPIWAHRRWDGTGAGTNDPAGAVPVQTGEPTCNLFGLGMCYLPWRLIQGFLIGRYSSHFGDKEFSMWHWQHVERDVPITWDVRPVHLNYQLNDQLQERAEHG